MDVYTHVAMGDLHADIEALPGVLGEKEKPPSARADDTNAKPPMPENLVGLISSWDGLPNNVRSGIVALAAS